MTTIADMSAASLRRNARLLRAQEAAIEAESKNAEAAYAEASAPFKAEQEALSARWNADPACVAAAARVEASNKAKWEGIPDPRYRPEDHRVAYRSTVVGLYEAELTRRKAEQKVPFTAEEFADYLTAGAAPFYAHPYAPTVREPFAVGAFVVLAATEGYDHGGDKFYLAVAGDPHGPTFDAKGNPVTLGLSIKGWLKVTPPEHRGDSTTAEGEVDGKPFLYGRRYPWSNHEKETPAKCTSYAIKPLGQFKAALLGKRLSDEELRA